MTNQKHGTLYTGHTDDLGGRIWEHKEKAYFGFSSKYGCDKLVWFESHETRDGAFKRERLIERWVRPWKIQMIEDRNPSWQDLYCALDEDSVYNASRMYASPAEVDPRSSLG